MRALQGGCRFLQMGCTDVECHVGRGLHRLQQRPHLAGAAGTEFHDHAGPHGGGDLLG